MAKKIKRTSLQTFGAYLKQHREEVLSEKNLLSFSYSSSLDNSKLAKIEKGEVNIRFNTLLEIAKTYKLDDKTILGFKISEQE
ncbi:hypothetical protein [Niabella beijingensis]|uniref:hypothetical protein n=1 Tax=Niabella beijingensis TaxID=2872700 RepID=UPI001CBB7F29|nr:hypothetical protein [Niabella beijingensis]MBZ4189492.1 hypothetical protein [Niabella beijingensis]